MAEPTRTTRLAPTPSGPLHLGHAAAFLVAFGVARRAGWRIVLRIEDIDAQRCSSAHEQSIRETLRWLGIEWDAETPRQSTRRPRMVDALAAWAGQGLIFHAPHSRRDLRMRSEASAPHGSGDVTRFPRDLRPPGPWSDRAAPSRFDPSIGPWRWCNNVEADGCEDGFLGAHRVDTQAVWGDPIVWTREGAPSYQFAVSMDDGDDGVTDVIRGADLLQSSALQAGLHRAMGRVPPRWWHVPLFLDATGRRLAKRDGALSLEQLRLSGFTPEMVIGRVGQLLGLWGQSDAAPIGAFVEACALDRVAESLSARRAGIAATL